MFSIALGLSFLFLTFFKFPQHAGFCTLAVIQFSFPSLLQSSPVSFLSSTFSRPMVKLRIEMTNGCFVMVVGSSETRGQEMAQPASELQFLPSFLSFIFLPSLPFLCLFLSWASSSGIGGSDKQERVVGKKGKKLEEVGNTNQENVFHSFLSLQLSPPSQPPLIQGNKAEVTRTYVFQLLLDCYFQPGSTSGWHPAMLAQGQHVVGLLANVKNRTFRLSN